MTEENELSIHDMCERVGRAIAPCPEANGSPVAGARGHSVTCDCGGTGVYHEVLNALYELARDVADLAESEAGSLVTDVVKFSSSGSGAWN